MVNADTLQHSNVREIGAENICHTTWDKLQLTELLPANGFTDEQAQLACTQVISRAVYPASKLKTTSWIKENSAVCELTGQDMDKLTKDKLYESALHLYKIKDSLEKHLSNRTNELFDLEDKIILYDLTNTYFEGEKRKSKLAKFGRSKEKRSDAKLVVTTAGTNTYNQIITTRRCSVPHEKLSNIYNILKLKHQPFTKRKSVVHKLEPKKLETQQLRLLQSG